MRLTALVHERLAAVLKPGDIAADVTAGNGHDALFLANAVGETGRVFVFDIQPAALDATRARLERHGVAGRCELIAGCHSALATYPPATATGGLGAVTANLGYLPGGEAEIVTLADSTLKMLRAAADRLRPGGVLSVIAYPGHPGGEIESAAVAAKLRSLAAEGFLLETHGGHDAAARRPWLAFLTAPGG